MRTDFNRTVWRGVELDHPADWELMSASRYGAPGACTLADRRHERLKIQWRPLKAAPNLAKLLEEKKPEPERKIARLTGQPTGWHGTTERTGRAMLVHAGRFFADDGLLIEVMLLWPGKRDRAAENALLQSVRPAQADPQGRRLWQAMGLRMTVGAEYDLLKHYAGSGQVAWGFGPPTGKNAKPVLGARRMAMPRRWLSVPLEEWLQTQLGEPWRKEFVKRTAVNGHTAARMTSARGARIRDRLGGRRLRRTDLAWECPVENRVYHVQYEEPTGASEARLPEHAQVNCCAPYRVPAEPEPARRAGKEEARVSAAPDTADLLAAVPFVNRAAKLAEGSRGSLRAEVPLKRPWFLGGPVRWIFPVSDRRRMELDSLGVSVLDLCDGNRTVERIVWEFATRHKLSFLEAQEPVMEYMRQLARRGILAVAGWKESEERA